MRKLIFLLHAAVTTLKMAGDAIVSALWRLNVYGAIMHSLLFFSFIELECFWWSNHAKLFEIVYKKPAYSSALSNNIYVRIWIFLSTSFEKQIPGLFEPLEWFARGSG